MRKCGWVIQAYACCVVIASGRLDDTVVWRMEVWRGRQNGYIHIQTWLTWGTRGEIVWYTEIRSREQYTLRHLSRTIERHTDIQGPYSAARGSKTISRESQS